MDLADYLAKAGVKTAAKAPTTAPAVDAAKIAAEKAAAEKAAAEKAAAEKAAAEKAAAEKAAAEKAAAATKTAHQVALEQIGITVADPKVAEALYNQQVKAAEANKLAELQAVNDEYEARGALQYHGMIKEACAVRLALGEKVAAAEIVGIAGVTGCTPDDIMKRASELKKLAEIAGSSPSSAFFMGAQGSAARDDAQVMRMGEQSNATVTAPASDGPRAAVGGRDEKQLRFIETVTLPGNPGLNHGQNVDHGKA
jgi:ATPase subunit of ABC transporter with duplicated ATPase domains